MYVCSLQFVFYTHKNPRLHTNVLTQLINLVLYREKILRITVSISYSGFIASFLLGPYQTGCSWGVCAFPTRVPAFHCGPVPASCCSNSPQSTLGVEAGSLWNQPRVWRVWLPTEEHCSGQVSTEEEEGVICICLQHIECSICALH